MIALNELIKSRNDYENAYKLKGLKENLEPIFELVQKLKVTQLEIEELRAQNNNSSSKMAELKQKNLDIEPLLKEIIETENKIKKLSKYLYQYESKINHKLKSLHNLPDNLIDLNVQIDTNKTMSNFTELESFIKSFMKTSHSFSSTNRYLKKYKNRIFHEDELPKCIFLRNGIIMLVKDYEINDIMQKLLNYFKENCMSIIMLSTRNLDKSSSAEYLVQINNHKQIKLELKREFFTREFKIKYKNQTLDMTKFVNQINIKYK